MATPTRHLIWFGINVSYRITKNVTRLNGNVIVGYGHEYGNANRMPGWAWPEQMGVIPSAMARHRRRQVNVQQRRNANGT